jgi:hypothetical protein
MTELPEEFTERDSGIWEPDVSRLFFALNTLALAIQALGKRCLLSADLFIN